MQRFLMVVSRVRSRGDLRFACAGRLCCCRRLSGTATSHYCRLSGWRLDRYLCAPVRRLAQQASRPAVHRGEPPRRRQQSRDRSGRQSPPDGYAILLVNPANTINASLYKHLNFNFLRDVAPVGGFIRVPNVMEVNPSVPAKNVAEFIAYAKANPDKVNVASSGNGTSIHLSGELFKMMTGTKMTHVPYKGSAPMLTDLLGGQVQVTFDNLPSSIGHIKAGKLRALAVTTAQRSDELPDVPTVAETVPGYEASAFFGFGVPAGTPKEIVEILNKEINLALKDPGMIAKLKELGGTPIPGTPEDFGKLVADETAKWEKVVRAADLSVN